MQAVTERQRDIYRRWAPVYDAVYAGILRRAHRMLAKEASAKGGRVLEAGVGTGLGLPHYGAGCRVVGIDISEDMLKVAKEKAAALGPDRVEGLLVMDAQRLAFPDGAFDVAALPFVITLVPDPEAVLDECARVLKPGGLIVVASRLSTGGPVQKAFEDAVAPLASRIGLSASFQLSRITDWAQARSDVELAGVEALRPSGFFKLVTLRKAEGAPA